MNTPYIPKLSLTGADNTFKTAFSGHVQKTGFANGGEKVSFKDMMVNTLQQANQVVSKPDTLLQEAMTTGAVDVHDVMIANAKAELTVSLTASVATKVVQAYDKILQIQI